MRYKQVKYLRGGTVKCMIIHFISQGGPWVQILTEVNFVFFFFPRISLIPSQSASIFLQALRFYLIAENNYPHVLVVLFQKSSTARHILVPSIFDMPLLYSISSLKSMTDMRGSSNFRHRERGQDRI